MTRLGVITGLQREVRCLASLADSVSIACAGADSERARVQTRSLLKQGCQAIVSFGIAGGLDPEVEPGTVVIAQEVLAPDGTRYSADPEWRDRVLSDLADHVAPSPVIGGAIAGSGRIIATAAEKRALLYRTGAVAVDMESHAVGEVASSRGVRFIVIRAVADSAERKVPESASHAIAEDGSERIAAVVGHLAVRPWELPSLIALARANARATQALRRVVLRLGPEFGLG